MDKLGENIKNITQNKGITIKDLTAKINMTETGYYASIRNKSMKLEKLLKISEVLEVPVAALLDDNTNRELLQSGFFNQAGNNNKSKIMPGGNLSISSGNSEGKVVNDLEECKKERDYLKSQNELQAKYISVLEKNQTK